MQRLNDLIKSHEGWLTSRIIYYAKEHNYVKYTSTLMEATRKAIVGLSESILAAMRTSEQVPELSPDEDYTRDSIAFFGILEARRHRGRGVTLAMFLGRMKYYRQSFIDLISQAGFEKASEDYYKLFINRVFDRIEIGLCLEWTDEVSSNIITDLQERNRTITNEKNKYLTVFESLPSPVILLSEINQIVAMNHAASILLQGSSTPGAYYYREKQKKESLPWFKDELEAFVNHNDSKLTFEKELKISDGTEYFEIVFARMLDISGKFSGTVVILHDITERKQLENEIARLDRLDLIGEMAAGIGHEIRNPMTTVRGFLQLLSNKEECFKYKGYYSLMIEELDRANSIITEFLSLAKNKTVNLKKQNLNDIIEAISPLVQADAMVSDKFIILELGKIPNLFLDEKEIRQLSLNMFRNGLEAMPAGGTLTIRTYMEGNKVVLSVHDKGNGIRPEALEKLGTPFFTTKEHGTGLGLAVCYSIATRHNATISVETSPAGTTFLVRF